MKPPIYYVLFPDGRSLESFDLDEAFVSAGKDGKVFDAITGDELDPNSHPLPDLGDL